MAKQPRTELLTKDLVKIIAENSSFTQSQVQEFFLCYANIVYELISNPNSPEDLHIALPHIGTFSFGLTRTRNKGMTKYYTDFKTGERVFEEYQEDLPRKRTIRFKIYGSIKNLVEKNDKEKAKKTLEKVRKKQRDLKAENYVLKKQLDGRRNNGYWLNQKKNEEDGGED